MIKPDFPPLYPAGFHKLSYGDAEKLLATNIIRKKIWDRFTIIKNKLDSYNINYELWIDGSFSTEKEHPGDIDVVLRMSYNEIKGFTQECSKFVFYVTDAKNKQDVQSRYLSDIYFLLAHDDAKYNYWYGQFGLSHDRKTPKGIIVIEVNNHA